MHIHPHKTNHYLHQFVCDGCRRVAGEHEREDVARQMAYDRARTQNWTVKHPRWQFYCPDCKD